MQTTKRFLVLAEKSKSSLKALKVAKSLMQPQDQITVVTTVAHLDPDTNTARYAGSGLINKLNTKHMVTANYIKDLYTEEWNNLGGGFDFEFQIIPSTLDLPEEVARLCKDSPPHSMFLGHPTSLTVSSEPALDYLLRETNNVNILLCPTEPTTDEETR